MYADVMFVGSRDRRGVAIREIYQAYFLPFRDFEAFRRDDTALPDIVPALPGMRLIELVETPEADGSTWVVAETPILRWLINHDHAVPITAEGMNARELGGRLAVEMPRAMVVGGSRRWSSRAAWFRELTDTA